MVPAPPALITSTASQYEILSPISGGADWVLYEATSGGGERGLLRIFDYSISPRRKGHVMSRARLIRDLDLPGIAKILDIGELVDGRPYVFMEGSGSMLLVTMQQEGAMCAAHVCSLATQLAQILERAYVQGLTYLELRPDSVQIRHSSVSPGGTDGIRVVVLPGDMVRYSRPATTHQITLAEEVFSPYTLAMQPYIAPELRDGGVIDDRTIAYALGAVLHDVLYGATPRGGKTSTSAPHIPEDLARTSLIEHLVELVSRIYVQDIVQRPDLSSVAQHLLWFSSLSDMLSGVLLGGKYQLLRIIALGGMGAVCEAQNTKLGNRRVAIKLLYPHVGNARVTQEINAAILAGTAHPDIVEILDHGVLPQLGPYIVMEYLAGETLSSRLRRLGGMAEPDAVRISRMIAAPLKAAHAVGVIHRDLKPDNIIFPPGATIPTRERVKILDFGIARVNGVTSAPRLTRAGTIMGTPNYMAPEQLIDTASATDRADVFALGAMLYEFLGGGLPIAVHVNRPLRRVASQPLMNLIARLTDPDPAVRPSMAEADRLLTQLEQRATRWLALVVFCLVIAGGLAAIAWSAVSKPGRRREQTPPAATILVPAASRPVLEPKPSDCRRLPIKRQCIHLPESGRTAEQQVEVVRILGTVGMTTICAGDRLRLSASLFAEIRSASGTSYLDESRLRRFWGGIYEAPQFPEQIPKRVDIECPLESASHAE